MNGKLLRCNVSHAADPEVNCASVKKACNDFLRRNGLLQPASKSELSRRWYNRGKARP